jgi:hypothetical protein
VTGVALVALWTLGASATNLPRRALLPRRAGQPVVAGVALVALWTLRALRANAILYGAATVASHVFGV